MLGCKTLVMDVKQKYYSKIPYSYTTGRKCLHHSAPATTRAFYFFNHPQAPKTTPNTWHHHHPQSPILSRFFRPKQLKYFRPRQSKAPLFSISTDTFISSTQLPNTSLPIAFTDTISSPKSHRNLMPFIRYLIEA